MLAVSWVQGQAGKDAGLTLAGADAQLVIDCVRDWIGYAERQVKRGKRAGGTSGMGMSEADRRRLERAREIVKMWERVLILPE